MGAWCNRGYCCRGGNDSGNASNQLISHGITIDSNNNLYITDTYNNRVMKWEPDATEGVLVAGGNDSGSANNQFDRPFGSILIPQETCML